MKTIFNILSRLLDESYDRPETGAWDKMPSYRPGPALVPVRNLQERPFPGRPVKRSRP